MCDVPLDVQRKFEQRWAARFAQPAPPKAQELDNNKYTSKEQIFDIDVKYISKEQGFDTNIQKLVLNKLLLLKYSK